MNINPDFDDAALSQFLKAKVFGRPKPYFSAKTTTECIRHWMSALVPIEPSNACGLDIAEPDIHEQSLARVLHKLERRDGSFLCGGTNNTLARVFRLMGYEAVTLCIGDPDIGLAHIVTLVRTANRPDLPIELHDAYFNYTLVGNGSQPLDFFDARRKLLEAKSDGVQMSRLRTWKTELSPQPHANAGFGRHLRAWYWNDPNWHAWLSDKGGRKMVDVFKYVTNVYGGESADLLAHVTDRLDRTPLGR